MAIHEYGFFDSTADDIRDYTEVHMSGVLRMLGDGVEALGDNLRVVSAQNGLHTQVLYGDAMINGYYYRLKDDGGDPLLLAHEAALSLPRMDRVVLRVDRSEESPSVDLVISAGTPAASPKPPALRRDDQIWEKSLANVLIMTGAGIILDEDIVDERSDPDLCGVMVQTRFATHRHNGEDAQRVAYSDLDGAPSMLPADGGNADTLGTHPLDYFGKATDIASLRNDIVDMKDYVLRNAAMNSAVITLLASSWANDRQTVHVTDLLAEQVVWVSYYVADKEAYQEADIWCAEQHQGSLVFACGNTPTTNIRVSVAYRTRSMITSPAQ